MKIMWFTFNLAVFLLVETIADSSISSDLIENHSAWSLIPTDVCGTTRYTHHTARIIGGENAKLGQFPWIAQLGFKKIYGKKLFNCGGSLITDKYVITAGHCGTSHDLVRLGEHDTTTKIDCSEDDICTTYQDIDIEKYVFNDFETGTLKNDLCLILLAKSAEFNEFIKPVCLPRGEILNKSLLGKKVHVAGWGYTNSTTHSVATVLQYVSIPIVESSTCNDLYTHVLTENQCCAGYSRGKDSCNGDSGGPMTKSMKLNGERRTYLIGIVSYGRLDCGEGPAVYTLVAKYMFRILDNIKV